MHLLCVSSVLLVLLVLQVNSQDFQPPWPAAPIITRSPYLNAWIDFTVKTEITNHWPQFWSGNHILGMSGLLRVDDGDTYEWMGRAMADTALKFTAKSRQKAAAKDIIITPTSTVLVLAAGPIQFNVTFLSPIEPSDITLQSFPFSYVFCDVVSTDGQPHHVQVYLDVTGEWLAFSQDVKVQWGTTESPVLIHNAQLSNQKPMQEEKNMCDDGVLYYATKPDSRVTWQTGEHYVLRSLFLSNGTLNNTSDTKFRNINDRYPLFAYAHDLGSVTGPTSVVWAVGLVRNAVIKMPVGGNSIDLPAYWTTKYKNGINEGIQAFLEDAEGAKNRGLALDRQIQDEAMKISPDYSDLISLATRQTFAGVETAGGPSDSVYMFMKDIGATQRVSAVENLYAAFPAFLYINSTWGRYLLEPLLQYQASSQYTVPYAAPDIGTAFPNAVGNPNQNVLRSVDDSSAMLIMAWAQARFSGDQNLLQKYYPTFQKWADYIVSSNPLYPSDLDQTWDELNFNNMTNLAIKGITGVRAMAEISHAVGKGDDASRYLNQSQSWASSWQKLAVSNDHITSTYSQSESWAMMYNLYPDTLLNLKLISPEIYDMQDQFYANQVSLANKFGLPYDSNVVNVAKAHWTMLTAATARHNTTQNLLIQAVYNKMTDLTSFTTFPTTYGSGDGKVSSGTASPALGASFSLLALNLNSKITGLSENNSTSPSNDSSGSQPNAGAIAGGVIGGLAIVAFITGTFLFIRRRKRVATLKYKEGRDLLADREGQPTPSSGPSLGNSNSSTSQVMQQQISPLQVYNPYQAPLPPIPRKYDVARNYTPPPRSIARSMSSRTGTHTELTSLTSDASQLRDEVENLRREMEEMRTRSMYDPPPEYT